MRFSKFCHTLYVATLIAVLLAAPTRSFADSFEVVLLTNDDATFLGLSSNGTAYFDYNFGGCGPSGTCYNAYSNGTQIISNSSIAPTFTPDDGTPCTPTVPSGTQFVNGLCNNGLDAYSARSLSLPEANLYWGTAFQDIWGAGVGPLPAFPRLFAMNSVGDIVFDDESNDKWFEAIDLTSPVPEPSGILLFATGIIGVVGVIRKRLA